jgi:sulfofructose kinase
MRRILITQDIQVIGLGQACLDYLGSINIYPEENSKLELIDLQMQCGGPASTALVTLSRLGIRTSFVGSISNDSRGIEIVKGLKKENVDFTFLKITPGYTSQFAFIAITKGGNRTIFWHKGSVPHLKPGDINLSPFSHAKIIHLDSLMIDAAKEAARQAKHMGLTIVMDAGTMREGFRELASMVDTLIASESFAEPLVGNIITPEKALRALHDLGPKEVIITLGSKGSIGLSGKTTIFQKAFPVNSVDTTGAGDVYHGAYIYGLLMGWNMQNCMRFASAASAIKCRSIGARKGIPHLEEIKEFMRGK